MGTRNLTAVVLGGKYVVAQYGQWDGYPSGQGATVLQFVRDHLGTTEGRAAFLMALGRVRFMTDDEHRRATDRLGQDDAAWRKEFPLLSRNHGAKVLALVLDSVGEVLLEDSSSFAADSLFCEWAYVVDLDTLQLEVFRGFSRAPLGPEERFARLTATSCGGYYPVRLVARFGLNELPARERFEKTCCPPEADEDAGSP